MAHSEEQELPNAASVDVKKAPSTANPAEQESAFGSDGTSSSEESDESSSDEDGDGDVDMLPPGQKPDFSAKIAAGAPSLEDRLKSFLPQLAEANSKLDQDGGKGQNIEDVKDDEPHIEMSLGLGLLEEKSGKEGEEEDSSEDEGEGDEAGESSEKRRKEKDVMGKLMGGRESHAGGIEEVG